MGRARRRLEQLLRADEAVGQALHEAAEDVLAEVRAKKTSSPTTSGSLSPYRSVDFERYVRRIWHKARTKEARNEARRMLRDGVEHGLVGVVVGGDLSREFGEDEP